MEKTYLDYEGLKHLIATQEAAGVDDSKYLKQYAAMPEAGEDLLDEIAQYIGATTSDYTNGYFYKCVSDGETTPTYSWVEVIGAGEKEVVHVDTLPVAPDIEDKVYETYGSSNHVVMTVPEVADFETYFSQFEFFNVSADAADVKEGYKVVAYDAVARIPNYGNWAITINPSPSSSDHPYTIYAVNKNGSIYQDNTATVGHTLSLDVVDESVVDIYVGDATTQTLIKVSGGSSVEVDDETIIKDANDVISVSPNFKATFKGTKAQWRALTAEQKAVFANGFVNITDDYEQSLDGKERQIVHSDSATSYDIEPNVLHVFGLREALTISFVPGESEIVNDYHFTFISGETPTVLTLPSGVVLPQGAGEIPANSIMEMSVVNNLVAFQRWPYTGG